MFMGNRAFKVDQIQGTLSLHSYSIALPEQIVHVVNESYSEVFDEINTIGPKLGREIQKRFEREVRLALL